MTIETYEKLLTANDTGETGGHQAGIHIPKSQTDLLALLPPLDPRQKNPDAWLEMTDDSGAVWRLRYVYYNNRLHDENGTRDEYRITHMTKFFRAMGAKEGDILMLSGTQDEKNYSISIRKASQSSSSTTRLSSKIKLRGWRRVY